MDCGFDKENFSAITETSWILFLKYLSDLEKTKFLTKLACKAIATNLFFKNFQWENWAVPKT